MSDSFTSPNYSLTSRLRQGGLAVEDGKIVHFVLPEVEGQVEDIPDDKLHSQYMEQVALRYVAGLETRNIRIVAAEVAVSPEELNTMIKTIAGVIGLDWSPKAPQARARYQQRRRRLRQEGMSVEDGKIVRFVLPDVEGDGEEIPDDKLHSQHVKQVALRFVAGLELRSMRTVAAEIGVSPAAISIAAKRIADAIGLDWSLKSQAARARYQQRMIELWAKKKKPAERKAA